MNEYITFEVADVLDNTLSLKIEGRSSVAAGRTRIQVDRSVLSDLGQEIQDFLQEEDLETYWESDIPGLGITPCITLRFLPGSYRDSVLAELYMELDDGCDFTRHNCCFYIHTDRTALQTFRDGLEPLCVQGQQLQLTGNMIE